VSQNRWGPAIDRPGTVPDGDRAPTDKRPRNVEHDAHTKDRQGRINPGLERVQNNHDGDSTHGKQWMCTLKTEAKGQQTKHTLVSLEEFAKWDDNAAYITA
jgi:hypothetical protein